MNVLIRNARIGPTRTRLRASVAVEVESTPRQDLLEGAARVRDVLEASIRKEVVVEMQRVCEAERELARQKGYEEGLARARAEAAAQAAQLHAELAASADRTLNGLADAHEAARSALADAVGQVSFAALCRLVGSELGSRAFHQGLVEQVLAAARPAAVSTVRLHPRDADVLESLVQELAVRSGAAGVRLIPDEKLALGGCVVESPAGSFDGGLEQQLRKLHEIMCAGDAT